MKYIIELEKIEGTDLYKAKGANTLVFDERGIRKILTPYKEEPEIDWTKVPKDTKVLVRDKEGGEWSKRHFCEYRDKKYFCYMDGRTEFTSNGKMLGWNLCKLAEDKE